MRIGTKKLDDAILNLGTYRKVNSNYGDKSYILQAIYRHDYSTLREVSNYFYEASGIYQRLCKYLAFLYRYDWYVTCYTQSEKANKNKQLNDFSKVLLYLDNSDVKRLFGNIALEVVKSGAYYGCLIDMNDKFTIQQLPAEYCRCRFFSGVDAVIELNMRFFDAYFLDPQYRIKVLSMFPKDIQRGYVLYKEGKLRGNYPGDGNGWFMIDPQIGIKFSLNNCDFPALAGAIPSIIDLDLAQELDRRKTMQQLLKIVVQKLPLDKNGEPLFDMEEMQDFHNNAVEMLRRAVGVDVLTTIADVSVEDMQDKNSTTTADELQKVERTVFNNLGTSQNLFNTDGNIALEKSISNDEAVMRDLLYQFQNLLNRAIAKFDRPNHYDFKANILETTIYNYKDLSKMYKEQTTIGYSKMLTQVGLGHSQSSIIAAAQFENDVLKLSEIMIPPMMSSTMSGKDLANAAGKTPAEQAKTATSNAGGRPEKADDEKSEKTIKNKESMS